MDKFTRSALFPLIVIVLLVYLASQTLTGAESKTKVPYSRIVQTVRNDPGSIERVVLEENRAVVLYRLDGTSLRAPNPNEASQLALERMLIARGVTYEWKKTAEPVWWSLITSLVPFALLIVFFVFLNSRKDERIRLPEEGARPS